MAVGDAVADTGYAYGIGLGSRMGIKPAFKFRDQLIMVFEPRAESESVATYSIPIRWSQTVPRCRHWPRR